MSDVNLTASIHCGSVMMMMMMMMIAVAVLPQCSTGNKDGRMKAATGTATDGLSGLDVAVVIDPVVCSGDSADACYALRAALHCLRSYQISDRNHSHLHSRLPRPSVCMSVRLSVVCSIQLLPIKSLCATSY